MKSHIKSFLIVGSFLALFLVAGIPRAHAATLQVSPRSGSYAVGQTIAVTVLLSSADQSTNAVSGHIKFPSDKLQALSVSKVGSILTIWSIDPKYSNAAETVDFEGVVPNPGFQSNGGKIVTMYFKVLAEGTAKITFSEAAALANDGNGTDILTGTDGAQFTLTPAPVIKDVPPPVAAPSQPGQKAASPIFESTTTPPVVSSVEPKEVVKTGWYYRLSRYNVNINILSLLLLIIIILLIVLSVELYWVWSVRRLYKRLRRRVVALDENIHHAFHLLYHDVQDHFDELQEAGGRRALTAEEKKFMQHIKDSMYDTEKFLVGKYSESGKKLLKD